MKRAVLFDLDGTLVDSVAKHYAAWREAFAVCGIELRPEDYYPREGMAVATLVETILKERRARVPVLESEIERVIGLKQTLYLAQVTFCPYPGVPELVTNLRRSGIKLAIVTASLRASVEAILPPEFRAHFDLLICSELAGRGKPFADPYLNALQVLALKPEECLVVENAPLGVQAAKAAQIYCIGVCSTVGAAALAQADQTVASFADLAKIDLFVEMLRCR